MTGPCVHCGRSHYPMPCKRKPKTVDYDDADTLGVEYRRLEGEVEILEQELALERLKVQHLREWLSAAEQRVVDLRVRHEGGA